MSYIGLIISYIISQHIEYRVQTWRVWNTYKSIKKTMFQKICYFKVHPIYQVEKFQVVKSLGLTKFNPVSHEIFYERFNFKSLHPGNINGCAHGNVTWKKCQTNFLRFLAISGRPLYFQRDTRYNGSRGTCRKASHSFWRGYGPLTAYWRSTMPGSRSRDEPHYLKTWWKWKHTFYYWINVI